MISWVRRCMELQRGSVLGRKGGVGPGVKRAGVVMEAVGAVEGKDKGGVEGKEAGDERRVDGGGARGAAGQGRAVVGCSLPVLPIFQAEVGWREQVDWP